MRKRRLKKLVRRDDFVWHQKWELASGVIAPGISDVDALARMVDFPDVAGLSVLDIGTTNGAVAFKAEAAGASRVVATDIFDDKMFGFAAIREALGSSVEFVRANVYEMPEALHGEQFDVVVFWGVLYHLRHPLLALDAVRRMTKGQVLIETAICEPAVAGATDSMVAQFYPEDQLAGDFTNWFAPSVGALEGWVRSSGFDIRATTSWMDPTPTRAHVTADRSAVDPRYLTETGGGEPLLSARAISPQGRV